MMQRTIQQPVLFEGKGLHTGRLIHGRLLPAAENTGVVFCRTDLEGAPSYPALATYVSATTRGTVLQHGEWRVSTVEHLLAALTAAGVDNCLVEVDGPEVPILDGSAAIWMTWLADAGVAEQQTERRVWTVSEPIEFVSPDGCRMVLSPADGYELEVVLVYPDGPLANQSANLRSLDEFASEIASARTFCFRREVQPLLDMGLIKGGDLDNALVIDDTTTPATYLSPLRYANEPARHKLLDVVGDLSLIGQRIVGRVRVEKPGHTFNTHCAKQLLENYINGKS